MRRIHCKPCTFSCLGENAEEILKIELLEKKEKKKEIPYLLVLGDREGEKGWVSLWGWGTPVLLRVDLGTPKCFQNASGSCGRALQALSSKAVPAASPSTAGLWDSAAAAARHRRAFSGLPLLALPGRILFLSAAAFGGFS